MPAQNRALWPEDYFELGASLIAQLVKNPIAQLVKNPPTGDVGSIPGLGRSLREGKAYPLQYSGLENSMDCIFSVPG